ncbi:hypothetical protein SISSUDRAFT_1061043 [Sistotremastrum suecicum HHB10207 ss-3]|uniref:Phage tail collar domain-containing protein n=1 Tax=Sistotremastrum suecicum HHB10207 ss-3 TaxID=1314776 RepID=A0A166EGB2_9AGAM|nr:hypothetical protein SISSUDRAFT_1061043 [Sistotremastrum suecicum HHB10207 ss-3]
MAHPLEWVPVGSILSYTTDELWRLPTIDWAVCEGQQLLADDWPELFHAIGYTNGGKDGVFKVPDLRGVFLRGATEAEEVGKHLPYTTGAPREPLGVPVHHNSTQFSITETRYGTLNQCDAKTFGRYTDGFSCFNVICSDKETRPVNVSFHYIIKLRSSPYVPTGAVAPFAGRSELVPKENWTICNGGRLEQEQALELYKVIGDRFTNCEESFFNVPDLGGQFVRGVDNGAGRDPDVHARVAPNGEEGDLVGTNQDQATGLPTGPHKFVVKVDYYIKDCTREAAAPSGDFLHRGGNKALAPFIGGDNETRPTNVFLNYFIQKDINDGTFPVGLIIAHAGTQPPSDTHWALCDGSERARQGAFNHLFRVVGTIHGAPSDKTFNLPDLRGRFIRGTDYAGKSVRGVDPDRFDRFSPAKGGAEVGPGSVQDWSTAKNNLWCLDMLCEEKSGGLSGTGRAQKIAKMTENPTWYPMTGGDQEVSSFAQAIVVTVFISIFLDETHFGVSKLLGQIPVKEEKLRLSIPKIF